MSVHSKMTAIADEIRELSGTKGTMGLDAMATNVGEANTEIGTQADVLAQVVAALEGKAVGGGEPTLQEKTVSPTTSNQTITPDSGYDGLSKVTVNAMATATQATPSISVSSAGLITASANQSAGYVASGTKSATKQLTVQAAKTVTPSTSSQTAVTSGVYTTGAVTVAAIPSTYVKPTTTKAAATYTPSTSNQTIAAGTYCSGIQTIKGDANLVAGNIKNGVSIFGVAGSYEGSGGGSSGGAETCNVTFTLVTMGGKATRNISYQEILDDGTTQVVNTTITSTIRNDGVLNFTTKQGALIVYHYNGGEVSISDPNNLSNTNVDQIIVNSYFRAFVLGQSDTATIYVYP